MLYTIATTIIHAVFRLLFTLEYAGEKNVPEAGAVIVAGNHPSYLDPLLVSLPLERRVYFMAWDRLFAVPVLGALLRAFGAFPVRLGSRDPNAYEKALEVLRDGRALGIFPEAGRSAEGPMNPLKTGTARLAIESGAPIVPVTISGAYDAWPSSRRLPWPRKITVKYHEPIMLDPGEIAERGEEKGFHQEITERIRDTIERRLLPSLSADERKRRAFAGPASPIRIYELDPAIAAVVGIALGGPVLLLLAPAVAHALYLLADVWLLRQGRLAKAARELATPVAAFALGPGLARAAGIEIAEWTSLVALGTGSALAYNWANRYKAERYVRGALFAYFFAFALALAVPSIYAPHLAFSAFTAIYAVVWRPLHWPWIATVAAGVAAAQAWSSGSPFWETAAYFGLAAASAVYIKAVKFSAHDGRMV